MSWDATIVGRLDLSKGTARTWLSKDSSPPKQKWPRLLARALDHSIFGDEKPTVAEVLRTAASPMCAPFGAIEVDEAAVNIRYARVDGSNYGAIAECVLRIAAAAAKGGASGRIVVCDANDAQVGGWFNGVLVTVGKGKLAVTEQNERFASNDKAMVDAVIRAVAPRRPTRASAALAASQAAIQAEVVARLAQVDEAQLRALARKASEIDAAATREQIVAYLREPLSGRRRSCARLRSTPRCASRRKWP